MRWADCACMLFGLVRSDHTTRDAAELTSVAVNILQPSEVVQAKLALAKR
jgi:hypothetical protein